MSVCRKTILRAFLVAGLLPLGHPAWADFVLRSAGPAAVVSQSDTAAPTVDSDGPPAKAPHKLAWHWKMAKGFGNAVPLGFACRQIVPAKVRVTYGPGANPSMVVSWKGGKGWNDVLRNAVQPIGLHLVMTYMAVEIRK